MSKSVTIQIASGDLETLKQNGYELCFAKKVNDTFNVVWQSYDEYLMNNTFQWTPAYQLFGSNVFSGDTVVSVSTNIQNANLGEQCTLDASGVLGAAATGGPGTAITLVNNFGSIHPGLNSISVGPDGTQRTTPIYVAEKAIVSGSDTLTPVEVVQVWFQQNVVTSTMLSDAVSNPIVIDLTATDTATWLYSGGQWVVPASDETASDPRLYLSILVSGVGAITAAALSMKIGTYLTGVYQNLSVSVTPNGSKAFKISYSETKGISKSQQLFLRTVWDLAGSADVVAGTALQALAALGSEYTEFDVTVAA